MKYAICILAHHKPWLIMSSLVSLAMQDVDPKDYDLHIIYIKGNGKFVFLLRNEKIIDCSVNSIQ